MYIGLKMLHVLGEVALLGARCVTTIFEETGKPAGKWEQSDRADDEGILEFCKIEKKDLVLSFREYFHLKNVCSFPVIRGVAVTAHLQPATPPPSAWYVHDGHGTCTRIEGPCGNRLAEEYSHGSCKCTCTERGVLMLNVQNWVFFHNYFTPFKTWTQNVVHVQ